MPVPEPVLVNGRWRPARAAATFQAHDPATNALRESVWPVSTWADCDEALDAAFAQLGRWHGGLPFSMRSVPPELMT